MPPLHSRSARTTAQALYSVFIAPTPPRLPIRHLPKPPTPHQAPTHRPFTTTPRPLAAKYREPEKRKHRIDDEISAQLIHIIDPSTNKFPVDPVTEEPLPPRTPYDVLGSIDRKTHRLVQVAEPADPTDRLSPAVCKIVSKKDVYEKDKKRKQLAKAAGGGATAKSRAESMKTLELNWAIDGNDLGHRLGKVREFLAEGRRVEVVFAAKKKGRKATLEECRGVLERVREVCGEVSGAKEFKGLEGKVGGFATLVLEGSMEGGNAEKGRVEDQQASTPPSQRSKEQQDS
ncbi:hypothetical protein MBLNU230_g6532t1 [Neophaeotheca triangularis]